MKTLVKVKDMNNLGKPILKLKNSKLKKLSLKTADKAKSNHKTIDIETSKSNIKWKYNISILVFQYITRFYF